MSTVVDERVVEMRFDNQQFEEGVRESMGTLSRFKMELDKMDSTNAFENIDKATQNIHLDGIAAGVEALQKRFSVFGLIGIKAVNGVADSLLGMAKRLYNITIGQMVSGGIKRAMNMENARFQLQALFAKEKNSAELVEQVMKDANKAVDGTAYSLDAAAKAASQFAATGIQAGQDMQDALRGIVGVAAMTNSDFESISDIFTTVAGQGRVMGDQLNQLASRGLNAAATMASFANGVVDGSIKASDEVTALVRSFGKGAKLTEADIRDLVSKGKISFKLFSEAMTNAFADSAEKANETFSGALSNVKSALSRIGAEFVSPLIAQNSKIVELFNALRLKINEFKKAIAFNEEVGNSMAVAKQFTDFVLKMAGVLTDFVNDIDTVSIMRDFYYGLETVKNVFKALWIIVKPALMATSGLINPIGEGIHTILVFLEAVTSRMIASESVSSALGEVLKEIVSIVGTLITFLLKLIQSVFKPLNKDTKTTSNGFVELLHAVANALKGFNDWLKFSPLMNKVFNGLSLALKTVTSLFKIFFKGLELGGKILVGFVASIVSFATSIKSLKDIPNIFDSIGKSLSGFSGFSIKGLLPEPIQDYIEQAELYGERVKTGIPKMVSTIASGISAVVKYVPMLLNPFAALGKALLYVLTNFTSFNNGMNSVRDAVQSFSSSLPNLIRNIFTLENLGKVFSFVTESGRKFLKFITESTDKIVAMSIGFGMVYGLVNISKALSSIGKAFDGLGDILKNVGKTIGNISDVMKQTKGAIKAYQNELNATAILKVSAAIAVLATSLIALSFADPKRLMAAAVSLAIVGGVLMTSVSLVLKAVNKTKNVYDALYAFGKNIGESIRFKAIAEMIKSLGVSLMMIAGSIIAIAVMYKKDSSAMTEALKIVGAIGLVIVGLITTMTLLGRVTGGGMKSFSMAAFGVAALATSLMVVVSTLGKLFKMKLPMDYQQKLDILYGVLMALTAITSVLTIVSNAGHGGRLTTMPIFLLFTSLHSIISAMQRLFKMSLPADYKKKLGILNGILVELSGIIIAMGAAARLAGGKIKAGGTILSISAFLVAAVGSLALLSIFPLDKIRDAAITLGMILLSLGTSLMMASTVTSSETAKAVLNMAIMIGTIVTALAVLTILDGKELLKGATALSLVLLAIGDVLKEASKITSAKTTIEVLIAITAAMGVLAYSLYKLSEQDWKSMLASGGAMWMVLKAYSEAFGVIAGIEELDFKMILKFVSATIAALPLAYALYKISVQPWKGMLASGIALGLTLKAFADAFNVLSETEAIDKKQIVKFVAATLAAVPLGAALGLLAFQKWDGILAAGVSLSATLVAYSKAFEILSKADDIDLDKIKDFLLASLAVIPIGAALALIAFQPWDNLLGAAVSLSATLLAFSGCFMLISKTTLPPQKLVSTFVGSSLALLPIAAALKIVAGEPWNDLLGAAASLSLVLVALSVTMKICSTVGSAAGPALIGIALLGLFIAGLVALVGTIGWVVNQIGADDSIIKGLEILTKIGEGLGNTVGSFVGGVLEGATANLTSVADNLSAFMEHLKPFTDGLENITEDSIKGVMMLGQMVASLTGAELIQGVSKLLGGEANFAVLGEQLNAMAPYLQTFSQSVANISPESVAGAKTASDILLALSDSLPRVGGILDKVLGTKKTLTDFAVELVSFGPAIKSFSQIVSGIDPSSVEGAAAAANIMAEVGNNLPPADGLVQKIFGQKTLSEFGVELIPFGRAIKIFASTVEGLDSSAVENAANAGGMMARLAQNLPSSGGWIENIFGNNDIDAFGEKLESFGVSIMSFAETVTGLDPDVLLGVQTATEMMTKLAEALPNTESVFAVFTGGQMDFKKFGVQLEKFGGSLSKYSQSIVGVDLGAINNATAAISSIVDLLSRMIGIDPNALSNFQIALSNLSTTAIQDFVAGFQNGQISVITAINELFNNIQIALNTGAITTTNTIRTIIIGLSLATTMLMTMEFSKIKSTMITIGQNVGDGLALGITMSTTNVRQAALDMANVVADATRTALDVHSPSRLASQIGGFWNQGLVQGLVQNIGIVRDAATNLAKNGVENPLRKSLGIHSPSTVAEYMGEMLPEGMAQGIRNGGSKVTEAIDGISEKAKSIMGTRAEKAAEYVKQKAEDSWYGSVFEVYGELKGTVSEQSEEVAQEVEKGAVESVEATKTVKEKGIKQEQGYWAELLKIKQSGIDASKYKDMDLKEFQENTLKEATDIWKTYTDQLSSNRDSIMSSMDIFSEVEKKETVSKEKMRKNIEDQIKSYGEYINTMASLNARLGDSEFGNYVRDMGVDSVDQLKVINSMTDEELSQYVELYDTKMAYATQAASQQLVNLQAETEAKLADVFGGMADSVNVFDFGKVFDGSFESIDKYVTDIMIPLQESNQKAREEASKIGEGITDGVTDGLDESNIDQVITEPLFEAFEVARGDQLDNAKDLGKEMGEYIYEGVGEGMSAGAFEDSAAAMMVAANDALREAGEIHSPSEMTKRDVGPYLTEGVAEGMIDAIPSINNAILEIVSGIISQFDENIEGITESASGIADAIQNGIGNKKGALVSDVREVGNGVISAMKSAMSPTKVKAIGVNIMTALINGIKSKQKLLITTVKKICDDMMRTFEEGLDANKMSSLGLNCIMSLNDGLLEGMESSVSAARDVCSAVIKTFEDEMAPSKFKDIGQNAVDGLLNGSKSGEKEVNKETEKIAEGSVNTAKKVLDEHSPSKVFYKIGKFIPLGLANGIKDYVRVVQNASDNMSEQSTKYIRDAVYKINDVINSDAFNDQITITPIVDLSNVKQSTSDIAKMFNSGVKLGANVSSASSSFNNMKSSKGGSSASGNGSGESVVNNYNFEQNNYSPKELSNVDIYRQTQNQIRFLKTQLG